MGWGAINQVVAGAAAYEKQYPYVRFSKVAITNQYFNATSIRQAMDNKVSLIDSGILIEWLLLYPQPFKVLQL